MKLTNLFDKEGSIRFKVLPTLCRFPLLCPRLAKKGYPLTLSEEGSGRGITLLTSPMSCTLPLWLFQCVCVCVTVCVSMWSWGFVHSRASSNCINLHQYQHWNRRLTCHPTWQFQLDMLHCVRILEAFCIVLQVATIQVNGELDLSHSIKWADHLRSQERQTGRVPAFLIREPNSRFLCFANGAWWSGVQV